MPFNKNNEWRPSKKQEEFLALPTTIREAAYLGGNGSGKSEVLLVYALAHRWHENPRFKQVFMRRTYPELRNEIIPRSHEFYRPFGAKFNKDEMMWIFPRPDQYGSGRTPDGGRIYFGHCETEEDVHKYDTMEINLLTMDELTSFTEFQYLYLAFERVRRSILDDSLPAIVRCAGTPGGIGHAWVKKRFVDPWKDGGKIIIGRGENKRMMIFATLADNPYIDPTYRNALEALPEAERKAKLFGDFDAYQGQVFEEFRDRHYPGEPEHAIHVIDPFEVPSWWPRIVVGDWGYRAMTWIGFGAISPDGRLYVYHELYWYKTKIQEWGAILREYVERENPRIIKFCKSVGQERGQEHTIQSQIEQAIGRPIELVTNSPGSRVAGKQLLHEYLRWKPRPVYSRPIEEYNEETALWILRNKGLKEYNAYLAQFTPERQTEVLPKLQIFNHCKMVIAAIKACVYAKSRDGKAVEDVAEFDGDDPYDGIRYMVDEADRYLNEAKEEFERVQKRAELLQHFESARDWTMLHRRMEALETSTGLRPVRRYRHYHVQ
ncbi:MAG: terminase family protein [Thermoplasmata archaeon]